MTILLPQLPVELWLRIFEDVGDPDLWLSVRNVSRIFRGCVEDIAKTQIIRCFSISTTVSLGSGTQHRWYDVRGTIKLDFKEVLQHSPQLADFEIAAFRPDVFAQRVAEEWNRICANGIDQGLIWNITMTDGTGAAMPVSGSIPDCVVSKDHNLRCDWRLLLCSYFARTLKADE
jgi:hypothetical protein